MRLRLAAVCGSVVVPMREPHAIALSLPFDDTLIFDNNNTDFWDNCDDLKTVFPGEGSSCMVVFLCTFALVYGATVPSSFATLVDSIDFTDPNVSIAAGESMLGVTVALHALAHNDFCTFFDTENKCGTPVAKFSKKFKDAHTPGFRPSMLIEEGF